MTTFTTKVSGIPCQCRVYHYAPGVPMLVYGPGNGDALPPESEEFDYVLLDRKGYRAEWLEKKLTPQDDIRLMNEYFLH